MQVVKVIIMTFILIIIGYYLYLGIGIFIFWYSGKERTTVKKQDYTLLNKNCLFKKICG